MPNYGDKKYWEQRYLEQKDTTFDWLEDYITLKPIIEEFKLDKKACKSIILGCGNAEFSEEMYDDGYTNIFNIDISETVIKTMRDRNTTRPQMIFEVGDVRDLKFDNNSLDLAVDKSTIDALLCGDNSFLNVAIMTKEVQRVLKVGGIYMVISYGAPENRLFHFERDHLAFNTNIYTIKKDLPSEDGNKNEKVHYVYLCKKKPEADKVSQENFTKVYYDLERQQLLEEIQDEEEEDEAIVDENDDSQEEAKEKMIENK